MPYLKLMICKDHDYRVWLSPAELIRLKAFPSERRRRDWLAGRIAAKALLRQFFFEQKHLTLKPSKIEISYGLRGSPLARIDGLLCEDLSLSISHSHGWGLAGLAPIEEGRVGVDIECIRQVHTRFASHLLTQMELKVLHEAFSGREHEGLILYWTLKEAAVKALQLTFPMSQLEVWLDCPGRAHIVLPWQDVVLEAYYERKGDFFTSYALVPPELKPDALTSAR